MTIKSRLSMAFVCSIQVVILRASSASTQVKSIQPPLSPGCVLRSTRVLQYSKNY